MLHRLPYPDRPDNHFKVDPSKWDYYSMDIHRMAGDNEQASRYASAVIADNTAPDGTELSPMRISECRITLGFVAETERQVEHHLATHLEQLPADDARSRAILVQMQKDEQAHGELATKSGGAALPVPVQKLMRATARVMTTTARWI
jgi:hypothetical protein